MKVIKDTIEPVFETWSDPGDYPNAVAQFPERKRVYLDSLRGEIKIKMTYDEFLDVGRYDSPQNFLDTELRYRLPEGVVYAAWDVVWKAGVTTFTPLEIERE